MELLIGWKCFSHESTINLTAQSRLPQSTSSWTIKKAIRTWFRQLSIFFLKSISLYCRDDQRRRAFVTFRAIHPRNIEFQEATTANNVKSHRVHFEAPVSISILITFKWICNFHRTSPTPATLIPISTYLFWWTRVIQILLKNQCTLESKKRRAAVWWISFMRVSSAVWFASSKIFLPPLLFRRW